MVRSYPRRNFGKQSGISRLILVVAVVIVLALVSVGVVFLYIKPGGSGTTSSSGQAVTLNGAGSTLVYPLMSSWTYNYTVLNPNIRINYASVGSGAGITQIEAKIVDFGASDAPLSNTQYTALTVGKSSSNNVLQIPEVAGAIVPAYNIPNNAYRAPLNWKWIEFHWTSACEYLSGQDHKME